MNPEHHEERLRMWAVTTGRPVLSVDYGKAPECKLFMGLIELGLKTITDPYPFASDEAFDIYRLIVETSQFARFRLFLANLIPLQQAAHY